jgi:hypothetical protein
MRRFRSADEGAIARIGVVLAAALTLAVVGASGSRSAGIDGARRPSREVGRIRVTARIVRGLPPRFQFVGETATTHDGMLLRFDGYGEVGVTFRLVRRDARAEGGDATVQPVLATMLGVTIAEDGTKRRLAVSESSDSDALVVRGPKTFRVTFDPARTAAHAAALVVVMTVAA